MNDVSDATDTARRAPAPASGVQTVPLPRDFSELVVSNGSGSVEVVAADRSDVRVEWTRRGEHRAPGFDEAVVIVRVDEGRIHVRPDRFGTEPEPRPERTDREGWDALIDGAVRLVGLAASSVLASMARFDIRVEVPATLQRGEIRVQTGSAPVRLRGLRTAVDVKTAAAEVDATGCVGAIAATTASGEVRLRDVRGETQVRSASGEVTFRGMAPRLQIETASGSIDATVLPGAEGEATLRTVSGEVRLTLPAGRLPAGGTVAVKTVSGSVEADAGFAGRGRREWAFEGGGPLRFEAQTVSGSVRLARVAIGPGARPEPGPAAPPSEPGARPTTIPVTRAAADVAPRPPTSAAAAGGNGAPPLPAAPPAAAAAGAAPPAPPAATAPAADEAAGPVPESAADRRRRVLEAVERGDLDVEEALRLLDDAGNPAG